MALLAPFPMASLMDADDAKAGLTLVSEKLVARTEVKRIEADAAEALKEEKKRVDMDKLLSLLKNCSGNGSPQPPSPRSPGVDVRTTFFANISWLLSPPLPAAARRGWTHDFLG